MNFLRRIPPDVLAAIGSIVILTYLPLFIFSVLIFPASDGVGGPLEVILIIENPYVILYVNLIVAALSILLLFMPISGLLDWSFQKVDRSGRRRRNLFLLSAGLWIAVLLLVIGSFTLAIGSFFENPSILRLFGAQSANSPIAHQAQTWSLWFLFLGGIPLVLGGATYWLLLQMSRKAFADHRGILEGSKSSIVDAEIQPAEDRFTKSQWKFLVQWSALNVTGWVVGIGFAGFGLFCLQSLEELSPVGNNAIVRGMLPFLLLGAGIGLLQWIVVGKFGIPPSHWTILTALGWSIGVGSWFAMIFAVQYYPAWLYSLYYAPFFVPSSGLHVLHLGLIGAVSIAGAILSGAVIGQFQSISLRRFLSRPGSWTRAYILAFLIPAVLASLIYLVKSILKRILFSLPFLPVQFSYGVIHMRWTLVFWFCLLAAVVGMAILTGRVLLKQASFVQEMEDG